MSLGFKGLNFDRIFATTADLSCVLIIMIHIERGFKACVYSRSLDGIVGSNPTEGTDVSCECCVLSGRGLCVRLVPRPEVVCLSVIVKPRY